MYNPQMGAVTLSLQLKFPLTSRAPAAEKNVGVHAASGP
jgi:hypothetical protein